MPQDTRVHLRTHPLQRPRQPHRDPAAGVGRQHPPGAHQRGQQALQGGRGVALVQFRLKKKAAEEAAAPKKKKVFITY